VAGAAEREVVLIEWKDRNPANTTFEGTARELIRLQYPTPLHPLGEMTFNPAARPGDPDWRVMYIGVGDAGSGEQRDSRRLNPQRLDTLVGKILQYRARPRRAHGDEFRERERAVRITNDPFSTLEARARRSGPTACDNPHRLIWAGDPARPAAPYLLAFNIGLVTWETVVIVRKGANYGYSLREGTQMMSSTNGISAIPEGRQRFRFRSRTHPQVERSSRPTR
jgi:hypothetical protein